MKRLCWLGISVVAFSFIVAGAAQQQQPSPVDQHLKMLSDRLSLTTDQQSQIRPILAEMLRSFSKVRQDTTISPDERDQRIRQIHAKADAQVRPILTDEQRTKLEQLEKEHDSGQQK